MKKNIFFKKKNINIKKIFPKLNLKNKTLIDEVRPLHLAKKNDLTFFDSIKYKNQAVLCKASYCITTEKLEKFLPQR